jgi:hypothetical protein
MSELHNKNLWHRRARAQLGMQPLFVEHRGFDNTIDADPRSGDDMVSDR